MPVHSLLIPFLTLVISTTPAVQEAPVSDKVPQSAAVDPTQMIGKPLPSVQVADLEEKIVDLSKLGEETLVLEFTLPSCSFAKRLYIQKRVQPLIRRWGKSGVKWVSIDSTFFAHPQRWKDWAAKYSLDHQFLLDKEGQLAESLGVRVSPTYVVIHKGKVAYHGALDDDIWGQNMERVVLLDNALKAILAGEQAPGAYNKPYGMAIRTRKVEDVRRKEFEEARKKALKELQKPGESTDKPSSKD